MYRFIILLSVAGSFLLPVNMIRAAPATGDQTIYIPKRAEKEVLESARDMAYWLEKAGAGKFDVLQTDDESARGIRLIYSSIATITANQKKQIEADGQSFLLIADGVQNVQIVGSGKNSFINGIYTFLSELGFRWYMPGDEWAKLGRVNQPIRINKIYTPSFRDRMYAGSGGSNAIPGVDPRDTFGDDYILWNRRNRFNFDYGSKGHQGIAFYSANKEELLKHPEYFCDKKGGRNSRLNFDNADLVKLLINWSLAQKDSKSRFPLIGVDPADGSGGADDCLPVKIPNIKTWSDKYYWLANQVAGKLPFGDDSTRVTLYAYNNYAAPPSFSLHKNLYPVIIPYAFQNVSDPEPFINEWAAKMNGQQMGIYDYWNITQWSVCLPQFDIHKMAEKLKLWKQKNINSIYLESTFAKGPMGHSFWLAGQLMWNISLNFDSLYTAFLVDNFGAAARDIRRMYDRWSSNYMGPAEPSFSYADLNNASITERNPAVQQRLNQLKAYVKFVSMYELYNINRTQTGYEELVQYVISIHHLRVLHTSALITLYIPRPYGYTPVTDKKILEQKYQKIKPLTQQDIERNFQRDKSTTPAPFKISALQFSLKKIKPAAAPGKQYSPLYINNRNTYQFYLPQKKTVKLRVGSSVASEIRVLDGMGKVVFRQSIKANKTEYTDVLLNLNKGEYSVIWGDRYRFSRIQFPADMAVVSSDHNYDNAGFPWQYVYVPIDVDEIVYQDVLGPGINGRGFWQQPDGKKIQPQKVVGNIFKVPVPAAFRGKVWVLNIGHRSFRMLNIPDYYSLNPFEYTEE